MEAAERPLTAVGSVMKGLSNCEVLHGVGAGMVENRDGVGLQRQPAGQDDKLTQDSLGDRKRRFLSQLYRDVGAFV